MKPEETGVRHVSKDSLPWLPLEPDSDLVSVELLSADPVSGGFVLLRRAPPGVELPRHRTAATTTIDTLQGRGKFREYDWVAGPGSLVVEPASVCNTPQILSDVTARPLVARPGERRPTRGCPRPGPGPGRL